ncbi:MAG: hypothetical protein IT179_15420 [Acidobacteria bacterium]|nr:hypothetical protein [Acidobacteriota bacterium]
MTRAANPPRAAGLRSAHSESTLASQGLARRLDRLEHSGYGRAIDDALLEAARDARRLHKALGNPMATWKVCARLRDRGGLVAVQLLPARRCR